MSLDKIINKEFKEAATKTGKQYKEIQTYFLNTYNKIKFQKDIYTEFEEKKTIQEEKEISLAYTRDYIWFDEKIL